MTRKQRLTLTLVFTLCVCMLGFTGCMNTNDRASATEAPTAQPTTQPMTGEAGAVGANPDASAAPIANTGAQTGAQTAYDWSTNIKNATDELNRISEISQSYIVVDGNAAIVGVTFDTSYRGGLTERISSMVRQKLVTLDSSLQDVRVTAEPEQVKLIQQLSDKLAGGATIDQVDGEFRSIYSNIKSAG